MNVNLNEIEKYIDIARYELENNIDRGIEREIQLQVGKTYYFKCQGSGYYFIYRKVENEYITGDIVIKGGELTGKTFRLHWGYVNKIEDK